MVDDDMRMIEDLRSFNDISRARKKSPFIRKSTASIRRIIPRFGLNVFTKRHPSFTEHHVSNRQRQVTIIKHHITPDIHMPRISSFWRHVIPDKMSPNSSKTSCYSRKNVKLHQTMQILLLSSFCTFTYNTSKHMKVISNIKITVHNSLIKYI